MSSMNNPFIRSIYYNEILTHNENDFSYDHLFMQFDTVLGTYLIKVSTSYPYVMTTIYIHTFFAT